MLKIKDRLVAAGIHFGLSAIVAAVAADLVFFVWYPYPYSEISGGRELFFIVVSVDVILGPLLTFAVFDRRKSVNKLRFDFVCIGVVQLAGLAYGLATVFIARPVFMVLEYDRFRVVHALEVPLESLPAAPEGLRQLPVVGPKIVSLRDFKDAREKADMTLAALAGVSLSARPELWQSYSLVREQALREAKPLARLLKQLPEQAPILLKAANRTGLDASSLVYLPMVGRKTFWTVLLNPVSAEPLAYLPVDSF